jgi:putative sigma-54 modulation protein
MNINIKATNTTLTEAIRQSIESKLSVLAPFIRPEQIVSVELQEDTKHHSGRFSRVEVRIAPHNHYAESYGNDFYEALDLVIPKIKEQLSKEKDKKISLRRKLGNLWKRG